jgi:hypothetical protein
MYRFALCKEALFSVHECGCMGVGCVAAVLWVVKREGDDGCPWLVMVLMTDNGVTIVISCELTSSAENGTCSYLSYI